MLFLLGTLKKFRKFRSKISEGMDVIIWAGILKPFEGLLINQQRALMNVTCLSKEK